MFSSIRQNISLEMGKILAAALLVGAAAVPLFGQDEPCGCGDKTGGQRIRAYAPHAEFQRFDWIQGATIVGLCGFKDRADAARKIADAAASGANVIDLHTGLTENYEAFCHPDSTIEFVRFMAHEVHQHQRRAVLYIAGLEILSHDIASGHTALLDHPNWAQRNRKGEPALFDEKAAFWIPPNTEDIWLSPYAKDWLKPYLEIVRRLALTGIDGIYLDVPYWMTHFEGWGDTWASFDKATVAEFRRRTGLDPYKADLGNFDDPVFRAWVRFRMDAMDEFVMRVHDVIKAANPDVAFIVELYPGTDMDPVIVGADPYRIIQHCDAISHEYNPFTVAAARGPNQWLYYQAGVHALREITRERCKPSWMLTYAAYDSWQGDRVAASANLAFSHIALGASFWECGDIRMCRTTVDSTWRSEALNWIRDHEKVLYPDNATVAAGYGVYFSPTSRTLAGQEYVDAFFGASMLLLDAGIPYKVITPRSLETADVKVLILPDTQVLDGPELEYLGGLADKGVLLVASGEPGQWDDDRNPGNGLGELAGRVIRIEGAPEREWLRGLAMTEEWEEPRDPLPEKQLQALKKRWWKKVPRLKLADRIVEMKADGNVQLTAFRSGDLLTLHLFNTTGLVANANAVPAAVTGIRLRVAGEFSHVEMLEAFGDSKPLKVKRKKRLTEVVVPKLGRGATLTFSP